MDIVKFLETRIGEEESGLSYVDDPEAPASLASKLLAECAQKRRILEDWNQAAAAEGISDPAEARGTLALARRSMLLILTAAYRGHPDHSEDWHRRQPERTGCRQPPTVALSARC